MGDFARELKDWQFFYATVATASATLTGLPFVSLSLQRQGDKPDLAKLPLQAARRSFGDFLYLLMLALVFLVPHRSPGGLAIALFALGASRAIGLIRQAARTRPPGGSGSRSWARCARWPCRLWPV